MRCLSDIDSYLCATEDAYVVDRSFAALRVGKLFAIVCWGRPDFHDASRICYARRAELDDAGPHFVVMDYRQLEGVDPEAFQCLADFLNSNREVLGRVTARTALLVPSMAFAAATVSGFYNVVKSPYPARVFTDIAEAEAWLEVPAVEPIGFVVQAAAARRSTTAALAAILATEPNLGVDTAAERLGMSARTLQRRLQAESTTYVAEQRMAVIRRAKHLLTTSDQKVGDIATAVGMTPQHFSEVFHTEVGTTPAAWRAQHRKT